MIGCGAMIASTTSAGRLLDAGIFAVAPAPMALAAFWACRDVPGAFRRVMLFQVGASAAFSGYVLLRLLS